jgi:hypothetical protein
LVVVPDVEVVCAAAFSMLVSVGGMISGVVFGTGSETLALPQPPIASAARSISAASALPRGRDLGTGVGELPALTS